MGLIEKIIGKYREKKNQRDGLRQRGEMADRMFCLAMSFDLVKSAMEEYEKAESEYEQNPELFVDISYFKNGKPYLSTDDKSYPELDIEHVIDFINTIDDNISGDYIDDDVQKELMEISMCLADLPLSVSILPKHKIAVRRIISNNPV